MTITGDCALYLYEYLYYVWSLRETRKVKRLPTFSPRNRAASGRKKLEALGDRNEMCDWFRNRSYFPVQPYTGAQITQASLFSLRHWPWLSHKLQVRLLSSMLTWAIFRLKKPIVRDMGKVHSVGTPGPECGVFVLVNTVSQGMKEESLCWLEFEV